MSKTKARKSPPASGENLRHGPAVSNRAGRAGPSRTTVWIALLILGSVVAVSGLYLKEERRIAGGWGYSLDDSWIYATMARNLATGHGFAFNPDQPVAGATGPLYTFILALLYLLFSEVIWSAKIFGILCQTGAAVALYAAVRALLPRRRWIAVFAGLLLATSPALVWASLSGMEIPLYILLVCVGLACYARGRNIAAVLVWSLGVWVRPDGLFLVALGCLAPPREMLRRAAVALPVVASFLLFNHAIGGHWMPQTVGAKAHFGFDLMGRTWNMMREWGAVWGVPYRALDDLEEPVLLLPLLAAGAIMLLRKRPALSLYVIGLPLALSLFRADSGSHKRYILYVIPFGVTLAAVAMGAIRDRLGRRSGAQIVGALAAVCLVWQLGYATREATLHGWNVENINHMQRVLGEFAGKVTKPGDRIATNDIGAIGYFSGRPVVDLMGLITPQEPLPQMLSKYEPELLIVFVDWFSRDVRSDPATKGFVFLDADSTHKYMIVAGIELSHNTICSGDQMLAFKRLPISAPAPAPLLMERY